MQIVRPSEVIGDLMAFYLDKQNRVFGLDVAPMHVTSFIYLARMGFYDGVVFHRVIPGFMAQGGDPTGTGSGGAGYSFADELSGDETYPAGTLAPNAWYWLGESYLQRNRNRDLRGLRRRAGSGSRRRRGRPPARSTGPRPCRAPARPSPATARAPASTSSARRTRSAVPG